MRNRQPILLTGTHRSGTTWVGRTLSLAPRTGYIHEPWNQNHPPGICSAEFWGPYFYISERQTHKFHEPVRQMLAFTYHWRAQLRAQRPGNLGKTVREAAQFARYRRLGYRPLIKDPLALLSAKWLARHFDTRVVVLIRHPAAFVSSLKRLRWDDFPFQVFLQRTLLQDGGHPYVAEATACREQPPDLVDQAALVWRILNHFIARYRRDHPDWLFIRHEDISRDPPAAFRDLCRRLDLAYTPRMARHIAASSAATNRAEAPVDAFQHLQRDSRANIWTWKTRLSAAEIDRIKAATADVWPHFYAESDW